MSKVKQALGRARFGTRVASKWLKAGARLSLVEEALALEPPNLDRIRFLLPSNRKHLLVACMPKSGSTFLAAALAEATGFANVALGYGYEQNEQDLYLPALIRAIEQQTVTQQHMRGTDPNIRLINQFGLSPIILVRNLADVVVSIQDHLDRTAIKASMGYLNERYFELDKSSRIDLLIDLFLPWYVSFFVSWQDAELRNKCPVLWVRYEEMIADTPGTIGRILGHYNVAVPSERISDAIERARGGDVKLNKGIAGRGKSTLSQEQLRRIQALTRHYPWVDFSPIATPA